MTGVSRVAHLIESDGPGGAERVVVEMATALQSSGIENVVFVPARGEGWIADQLRGSGVEVEHFALDRPLAPECARDLTQKLVKHRVDVAHSHEFSLAVYGAWAARRAHVPHVITMHGGGYYGQHLRRRLAMRLAVAGSACTAAVSNELARTMSRLLWLAPERVRVVPNGVRHSEPEHITLRQELGLQPGAPLLVAIGNLYPVKGHAHLVEAMAALTDRRPALHLAICGRGDLAESLAARAKRHGLENRVHLLGLRSDVPAVLAAADIFVMPSLAEGLPLALLEAMFAGRPIVASNVGEVPHALGAGAAGILTPPGDEAALAKAIDLLLGDPCLAGKLGDAARARANAHYHVSRMVACYLEIYRSLVSGRGVAVVTPAQCS